MKIFRDLCRRMGIITLWYVCIFAIVIVVLPIIFKVTVVEYPAMCAMFSIIANVIYMLAIGVFCPLVCFSHYITAGVTRRQFALAMYGTAAVMAVCCAVMRILLMIIIIDDALVSLDLLTNLLISAAYGCLSFVIGWTAAVGFQFMRGVPILVGIVCAVVLFHGMIAFDMVRYSPGWGLPMWSASPIVLVAAGAIGVVLLRVVERIDVRC